MAGRSRSKGVATSKRRPRRPTIDESLSRGKHLSCTWRYPAPGYHGGSRRALRKHLSASGALGARLRGKRAWPSGEILHATKGRRPHGAFWPHARVLRRRGPALSAWGSRQPALRHTERNEFGCLFSHRKPPRIRRLCLDRRTAAVWERRAGPRDRALRRQSHGRSAAAARMSQPSFATAVQLLAWARTRKNVTDFENLPPQHVLNEGLGSPLAAAFEPGARELGDK